MEVKMGTREDDLSTMKTAVPAASARKTPGLDETIAAAASPTLSAGASLVSGVRSTVLPRLERRGEAHQVVVDGRLRYEPVRALGAGGQAEVTLARDHDIDRAVALKRLLPERNDEASVLRFAEEIRAV